MADTAVAPNYDSIIDRQHKRILKLEEDLAHCSEQIRMLKTRGANVAAFYTAHDLARLQTAQMHAMLAMPSVPTLSPHHHLHAAAAAQYPVILSSSPLHNSPQLTTMPPSPNPFLSPKCAPSDEEEKAAKTRYWTAKEHQQFLYAAKVFGPKNYVSISQFVGTRTAKQVRTHAQKYQMKLEREAKKRAKQALTASDSAASVEPEPEVKREIKCEDAAQSGTTSPTLMEMAEDQDSIRYSACSPVSNDEDIDIADDIDIGEDVPMTSMSDKILKSIAPAPVAICDGLKKNSSLGNLADYDDFMRRFSSGTQDGREGNDTAMFDHDASELGVDLLDTSPKSQQFEHSLLEGLDPSKTDETDGEHLLLH